MSFRESEDKHAFASHGVPRRLQQCQDRFSNRIRTLERNDYASLLCKQLLGVPVRRGNNRLTGSERNRERSGDDLRFILVGRDVDIGSAHML